MGLTYCRGLLVFASKLSYRYIQPQSLNYIEESSHQNMEKQQGQERQRGKGPAAREGYRCAKLRCFQASYFCNGHVNLELGEV